MKHALPASLLLLAALLACGKKGDPLPPLPRSPQPVTAFKVAQRGQALEVTFVAPRLTTAGNRLAVLEVDVLRADRTGEFGKVALVTSQKVAPGEAVTHHEPLPAPGTTMRFAARARDGKHLSDQTRTAILVVQAPPPVPTLQGTVTATGASLSWTPVPLPTPSPSPSPSPGPSPSPLASPAATPSPAPTPPPQSGYFVYRKRASEDDYGKPLQAQALQAAAYVDDGATAGQKWCYVVTTAYAVEPLVESVPSNEVCLDVQDIVAPAAPQGVAVLPQPDALEVSWSASGEADLGGYRVLRGKPGEEPKLLANVPAGERRYRDITAEAGVAYRYAVVAVDKSGNASTPSAQVEGTR